FYRPFVISPASGCLLEDVYATNCLADGVGGGSRRSTGLQGWHISGATGTLGRVYLTNCWAGSMISHGFEIQAATDIELSGCRAYDNGGNGVFVPASLVPTQVLIRGGVFSGNSYAASGTYSGIYIDNNVA